MVDSIQKRRQGKSMKPRYQERIPVHSPVLFTIGSRVGEGVVLNLTLPGCLIQSPMGLKQGEYLQLKMFMPGMRFLFSVALAAVRWNKGSHFGVEFIKMSERDSEILSQFISKRLAEKGWHKSRPAQTQVLSPSRPAPSL